MKTMHLSQLPPNMLAWFVKKIGHAHFQSRQMSAARPRACRSCSGSSGSSGLDGAFKWWDWLSVVQDSFRTLELQVSTDQTKVLKNWHYSILDISHLSFLCPVRLQCLIEQVRAGKPLGASFACLGLRHSTGKPFSTYWAIEGAKDPRRVICCIRV